MDTLGTSIETKTLDDLLAVLKTRVTDQELARVRLAYELAEKAHRGQLRKSGEPYITHPTAVAGILAHINLDTDTIAAALLHDVAEDTTITIEQLREQFGDRVARLVDGVTKLSQREAGAPGAQPNSSETLQYRTEREAESLRKMMLSVVDDERVVLIKLADRLHNMRTLAAMKPEKQKRTARETLDIYAPLANRLGIWEWKQELEDLGLRYADPETYDYIARMLAAGAAERDAAVKRYADIIRTTLADNGITDVEITGRAKTIYSLWRKMQNRSKAFDLIKDTQAIRVIIEDDNEADEAPVDPLRDEATTPTKRDRKLAARERLMADPAVQACYMALGVVHRQWPPIPGEFDDYIAVPKDNHYQSLHTAVQTDSGMLEVQIRTRSMHRAAEYGVAAHWLYKDSAQFDESARRQIETLRNAIANIVSGTRDAEQFVETLKEDQLQGQVFAFTPKGKVIELPNGATVLDFAYRIHSDIGDRCRGGRINGVLQGVAYRLRNGDVVEVLTRKEAMPNQEWLQGSTYCVTANAKGKIRAFFRKQGREEHIRIGREIIDREIKRMGVAAWMKADDVMALFGVEKGREDDFLSKVGFGDIGSTAITSRIMEDERRRAHERQERLGGLGSLVDRLRPRPSANGSGGSAKKGQFVVAGVPGLQVEVSQCCRPVPGDPVVGYVTRGQGIRVHHRDCKNILNAEQERLIDVEYQGAAHEVFEIQLLVIAAERTGLLGELATTLGEARINIVDVSIAKRDLKHGEVQVWLKVEVTHTDDATLAMTRLKTVRNVFDVQRVTNGRR